MRTISVRLDDTIDAALTAHCQRHGLTQTEAVKTAIEELTARHVPTPAELAAELGLIGSFSGAPDLARNRAKYIQQRLTAQRARDAVPLAKAGEPARAKPASKTRRGPVAA